MACGGAVFLQDAYGIPYILYSVYQYILLLYNLFPGPLFRYFLKEIDATASLPPASDEVDEASGTHSFRLGIPPPPGPSSRNKQTILNFITLPLHPLFLKLEGLFRLAVALKLAKSTKKP